MGPVLPDDKKISQMFQIIPRNRGFDKFYHTCEEIGRGTQGVTYFVQQAKKIYKTFYALAYFSHPCIVCQIIRNLELNFKRLRSYFYCFLHCQSLLAETLTSVSKKLPTLASPRLYNITFILMIYINECIGVNTAF